MTARTTAEKTEGPFTSYTEAMAWVQAELPHVHKDNRAQAGPKSYSYADLADVTQAILARTGRAGLAWTTTTTYDEQGRFVLRYSMQHTSGTGETGVWPLPDAAQVGPQVVGSALTYARRYSLMCVTGVAPDKDDDGQAAQQSAQQPRQPEPAPVEAVREPDVGGFATALADAWEQDAGAVVRVRSAAWALFGIRPDTEVVDTLTGEVLPAGKLLERALQRAEDKGKRGTAKVTRLHPGDPDPDGATWQAPVDGVVEDAAP